MMLVHGENTIIIAVLWRCYARPFGYSILMRLARAYIHPVLCAFFFFFFLLYHCVARYYNQF